MGEEGRLYQSRPRKERYERDGQRGRAGRHQGRRDGAADRRPLLRSAPRRHGRRDRQARTAGDRRPDAQLGPRRQAELVARYRAQQIFGGGRFAVGRGSGARARADRQGRHSHRKLPSRHTREMEPRSRRAAQGEPRADRRACVGLRPDRSLFGACGFRRHRRGDGRVAWHRRLSRFAAGAHGGVDRRYARRDLRLHGRTRGASPSQQHRRRPDRRFRAL